MMRSLYSGVSGVGAHQQRMDVIGNNIANVNTTGYKKSNVTFQDALSQTMKGASGPSNSLGGSNPQQIGTGVGVGTINTVHTQGGVATTGNMTDVMINGEGYFVLQGAGGEKYYTRSGAFIIDKAGDLVNSANGMYVLDNDGNKISIELEKSIDTVNDITLGTVKSGSLTAGTLNGGEIDLTGAEIVGNKIKLANGKELTGVTYTPPVAAQPGPPPVAAVLAKLTINGNDYDIDGSPISETAVTLGGATIAGNVTDGKLSTTTINQGKISDGTNTDVGEITAGELDSTKIADVALNDAGVTGDITISGLAIDASGKITGGKISINDGATLTTSNITAGEISGGTISKGSIDPGHENTTITPEGKLQYQNNTGERITAGTIGLAKFSNPAGLLKAGQNLYIESNNSGEAGSLKNPGKSGTGTIVAGSLEMSNVDIAEEFSNMIITQRGFQANTRTIKVSDELLQDLVNLKR